MPSRILLRDLTANAFVQGVYSIHNCQLGQTKTGKPFLKCLIGDRSARVPGRMWSITEEVFNSLPTDGFVKIEANTQPYQGQMQLIINLISPTIPTTEELDELLPRSEYDTEKMFDEVTQLLTSIKDPGIRNLAEHYLGDEPLMHLFKRAPAATNLHHAFLSGLLEHTLGLMRLAKAFCPLYPKLNEDVILMGLFIHDLGKCFELSWESGFAYTDEGQLMGHIARGVLMLEKKIEETRKLGDPVSESVAMVLHHIILSHHGLPEFGAAKLPSTPEAIAVSILDNLDAKMFMALSAARSNEDAAKSAELGGHFTEKIWALDTRLYRPDPTTVKN